MPTNLSTYLVFFLPVSIHPLYQIPLSQPITPTSEARISSPFQNQGGNLGESQVLQTILPFSSMPRLSSAVEQPSNQSPLTPLYSSSCNSQNDVLEVHQIMSLTLLKSSKLFTDHKIQSLKWYQRLYPVDPTTTLSVPFCLHHYVSAFLFLTTPTLSMLTLLDPDLPTFPPPPKRPLLFLPGSAKRPSPNTLPKVRVYFALFTHSFICSFTNSLSPLLAHFLQSTYDLLKSFCYLPPLLECKYNNIIVSSVPSTQPALEKAISKHLLDQ